MVARIIPPPAEKSRLQIEIAGRRLTGYNTQMSRRSLIRAWVAVAVAICGSAFGGTPKTFSGEYGDPHFLKGQAVFQLTLEQKGNNVSVVFSAAHSDSGGPAPEASGKGEAQGEMVTFQWEDSFHNSGTGTIRRAGKGVILSLKPTHVKDARCLEFYLENMRLKRAG
jgi:hypothetical protein